MKRLLLLAVALALPLRAQDSSASESSGVLSRVAVIGASVSAGFNLETDFAEVFEAMVVAEHEPVVSRADGFFFMHPGEVGEQSIVFVEEADATLVVAVDFLFWFGYGWQGRDGARITDEAQRLELLEVGLGLLDAIECPVVIGDFPDMSDAVGRGMLAASQQPRKETLAALSERVRAWAKERERVTVVPLASIVAAMRTGEAFAIGRHRWPKDSIERVLQDDRLHPTTEGLAALGHATGLALLEAGVVTEDELDPDLVRLMDALGESFEDAPDPGDEGDERDGGDSGRTGDPGAE